MTDSKKEFLERKERVMNALSKAVEFSKSNGFEKEAESLAAQYNNVKNEEFVITVIGEFSNGKSYLLNALMGEKLLPSYSGEATAAINFLRHKAKAENGEAICVYNKDGTTKKFNTADESILREYVCTKAKNNVTNIDHIDIFLESKFLEDNVTLVDTPGLSGLKSGLADLTKQQIEKSSASIFMFNARRPGSQSDFDSLHVLRKSVNSIILVLNAIDLIDEDKGETVESVIQDLENKKKSFFPDDAELTKVHPISAKMALAGRSSQKIEVFGTDNYSPAEKEKLVAESGMPEFEDYLFKYLTKGPKGRQILLGPAVQLEKQLERVNDSFSMEQEVLNGKVDIAELELKSEELSQAIAAIEKDMADKKRSVTETMKEAETEFIEYIKSNFSRYVDRYTRKVDNFTDLDEIMPERICATVEDDLKSIFDDAFRGYSRRLEEIIYDENIELNDDISSKLKNDGFEFKNKRELILTTFDTGIEEYERKLTDLMADLQDIKEKLDDAEDGSAEARKLTNKMKKLESKLERLEGEKHTYLNDAIHRIPNVVRYQKTDYERYDRDGFFGGLTDKVFGRKIRPTTIEVVDTTARDEYKKQINEITSNFDSDIASLESELSKYEGVDAENAERIEKKIRDTYEAKSRAISEYQKKFIEKQEETIKKQLKTQKDEVSGYIKKTAKDIEKEATDYFDKTRKGMTGVICNIITSSVAENLNGMRREIDTLKRKSIIQENERLERIKTIEQQLDILRKLRLEALDLKEELENIEVFDIE